MTNRPVVFLVGMFRWGDPYLADPVQQMAPHFSRHADVVFVRPTTRLAPSEHLLWMQRFGPTPVFWTVGTEGGPPDAVPFLGAWAVAREVGALYREIRHRTLWLYANSYVASLGGELAAMLHPARLIYDVYEHAAADPLPPDHRRLWEAADVRVAITQGVSTAMGDPPPHLVLGPGVDVDVWRTAREHRGPFPYAFGFFGNFSNWVDLKSLAAVADRHPSERMLLIGMVPRALRAEADKLAARPNVDMRPPVPYADLPAAVAGVEVFLLPRTDTAAARASDPIKLYDYLATGRPVVATPLPVLETMPGCVRVGLPGEDFANAAGWALRARRSGADSRFAAQRVGLAASRSWKRRVEAMLDAAAGA